MRDPADRPEKARTELQKTSESYLFDGMASFFVLPAPHP